MASNASDFRGMDVPSALWAPVRWTAMHLLAFVGLLMTAWIVDWIYVSTVWPDGVARLESILANEIAALQQIDCWCGDMQATSVAAANALYDVVFKVPGIHAMTERMAEGGPLSIPDSIARNLLVEHTEMLRVLMAGTQLFGVRVGTLVGVLPLLGLAALVGASEGLAIRAVRRACGGQESAGMFHRMKYGLLILLIGVTVLHLVPPQRGSFSLIWLLCAPLLGVVVTVQTCYLRKGM